MVAWITGLAWLARWYAVHAWHGVRTRAVSMNTSPLHCDGSNDKVRLWPRKEIILWWNVSEIGRTMSYVVCAQHTAALDFILGLVLGATTLGIHLEIIHVEQHEHGEGES